MLNVRRLASGCGLVMCLSAVAAAQPTITSSATRVTPGATVTLTVDGTAGQHYAVIASAVGAGFSYGGVALAVGPDVQIISQGVIGMTGSVAIGFTPPFLGTTLDRYYVQAVTATNPSFVPPVPSAGLILRNADSAEPPMVIGGTTSLNGALATLVSGVNYIIATPSFVAPANQTCLVTSSIQVDPSAASANGTELGFVRTAVNRNGTYQQDGIYGQYVISNGTAGKQASSTRSSVISIAAGETISFGVYFHAEVAAVAGGLGRVHTAYSCS